MLYALNRDPDGSSQVLWEDGERVFCRGSRIGNDGNRSAVLVVLPAAEHPSRSILDRLAHEYGLKDELDGAWAVQPLELTNDGARPVLVLEDTGGGRRSARAGARGYGRRGAPSATGRTDGCGRLPAVGHRTDAGYLERSKLITLRVMPLSDQFGIIRHGVNMSSRPPKFERADLFGVRYCAMGTPIEMIRENIRYRRRDLLGNPIELGEKLIPHLVAGRPGRVGRQVDGADSLAAAIAYRHSERAQAAFEFLIYDGKPLGVICADAIEQRLRFGKGRKRSGGHSAGAQRAEIV
jgi:hypothetical protein